MAGDVHDPDLDLVVRAGQGDQAAIQALVARKLPRVLTLAARMLGDRSDAEDVAQEVFVRVWKQAPRWQPGAARFDTWIHRVALNLCHDRLRLRRRREAATGDPPDVADERPSAETLLNQQQRAARVEQALQSLPTRQREALVLCTWQGMGNIEAAGAMDVTVEALESLLSRARRTLRTTLADLRED